MISLFAEYTRCPDAVCEKFAGSNGSEAEGGVSHRSSPAQKVSCHGAERLRESIRTFMQKGVGAVSTLDIDRAIDCLRFERYLGNAGQIEGKSSVKSIIRQTYYAMRPLFPVAFRKYLQRMALRGWETIPFPSWPVDFTTEEIVESTWRLLLTSEGLREVPFIWFWPEGRSGCCIMTHDVETRAGRDFCSAMMKIEARYGVRSAFELVPEQRYEVPMELLQQIRENGCEVCVHGLNHDGNLFKSDVVFFERAAKINEYARKWGATGFRSPVLYRNLEWFHALKFSYDMSVPNVGHLDPQRGGCCTVMPYFNGDILELPLTTVQDYSLYNILQQRSLDLWQQQMTMILNRHGLISFIIHPDYTIAQWSRHLYESLLGTLAVLSSDKGLWIALPSEVDSWWRDRHQMRLVSQNGRWRIQGPHAERARLAYASLENDKIVYRIESAVTSPSDSPERKNILANKCN